MTIDVKNQFSDNQTTIATGTLSTTVLFDSIANHSKGIPLNLFIDFETTDLTDPTANFNALLSLGIQEGTTFTEQVGLPINFHRKDNTSIKYMASIPDIYHIKYNAIRLTYYIAGKVTSYLTR